MSELVNNEKSTTTRFQLLAGVSVLALLTSVSLAQANAADDANRPTIWIELGAQLERSLGVEEPFLPPFLQSNPRPGFEVVPSTTTQRPPRYGFGGEGKVTFAPKGSDWSFVAAVRYGRSNGDRHLHQQTTQNIAAGGINYAGTAPFLTNVTAFGDTKSVHAESHIITDFTAGRDMGLGMWGGGGSSIISFGVRFAQFTSRSKATLYEVADPFKSRIPNGTFLGKPKYTFNSGHHSFAGENSIRRSFSGIGPTLSMSGSQSLAGKKDDGEITFDWGANAAVLFGRQKVQGSHETSGAYITNHFTPFGFVPKSSYNTGPKSINRSRSVIVPNFGGSAGISMRYSNTKFSLGYRGDFFFGVMDNGIDTRHTSDRSFHGPFATVSIGLGG